MRRAVSIVPLAIVFLMIPSSIHGEIYKWTDDKGTIHFTDEHSNIPEKYLPGAETRQVPKESFPSVVEQKSAPSPKSSELTEEETPRLFSGLINRIDGSGRSISVAGETTEMVFFLSEETRIMTHYGHNVPLGELRNGRQATVEYIDEDGILQARSVKVGLLLAATPNAVESDSAGKPSSGPGQLENPSQAQQDAWGNQKAHKMPKLPKLGKSSK